MNRHLLASSLALAVIACGKDQSNEPKNPGLAITIQPLSLQGVNNAFYTLTVRNAAGVVWTKTGLESTRYGDGRGALTYVGPCDASNPAHTIELTLDSLWGPSGQLTDFANPAPPGEPVVQPATCVANSDTPVTFNLTIARDARQGFFDIGVTFSDIFCSAKVDCLEDPLLHVPGGERGPTAVMAFACTSGRDTQGNAEDTWLHFTNVVVECGPVNNRQTYTLSPGGTAGNQGQVQPVFFQTALYKGEEELEGYDKCYWNMAFGVSEGSSAVDCRIIAQGTASDSSWTDETDEGGRTPRQTVYPYVSFDVTITDSEGNLDCGSMQSHGLNAQGSGVQTAYTSFEGSTFTHEWRCGTTTVTTEKLSCGGLYPNQAPESGASFVQTPAGVQVAFGNSWSGLYAMPNDYKLDDCCMNPCCTAAP
jgi:hypothetical protein